MPEPVLISVIDDDESVRLSLEDLLSSLGYAVRTFASAEEFLAAKMAARCACIISDIKMPGMNGFDLQSRLKEAGIAVPFIVMTSFASEAVRANAAKRGAACFLKKPFDAQTLIDCLKRALDQ